MDSKLVGVPLSLGNPCFVSGALLLWSCVATGSAGAPLSVPRRHRREERLSPPCTRSERRIQAGRSHHRRRAVRVVRHHIPQQRRSLAVPAHRHDTVPIRVGTSLHLDRLTEPGRRPVRGKTQTRPARGSPRRCRGHRRAVATAPARNNPPACRSCPVPLVPVPNLGSMKVGQFNVGDAADSSDSSRANDLAGAGRASANASSAVATMSWPHDASASSTKSGGVADRRLGRHERQRRRPRNRPHGPTARCRAPPTPSVGSTTPRQPHGAPSSKAGDPHGAGRRRRIGAGSPHRRARCPQARSPNAPGRRQPGWPPSASASGIRLASLHESSMAVPGVRRHATAAIAPLRSQIPEMASANAGSGRNDSRCSASTSDVPVTETPMLEVTPEGCCARAWRNKQITDLLGRTRLDEREQRHEVVAGELRISGQRRCEHRADNSWTRHRRGAVESSCAARAPNTASASRPPGSSTRQPASTRWRQPLATRSSAGTASSTAPPSAGLRESSQSKAEPRPRPTTAARSVAPATSGKTAAALANRCGHITETGTLPDRDVGAGSTDEVLAPMLTDTGLGGPGATSRPDSTSAAAQSVP